MKHHQLIDTLVETSDLYPTILAMAGLKAPVGTGINLLNPPTEDRVFYGNSLDVNFCVMKDKIKLVYSARCDNTLLFDMEKDPMEQHDLSHDPAYAETLAELQQMMVKQVSETRPGLIKDGKIRTLDGPKFPGDWPIRDFGFNYKNYNHDVFH